MATKVKDPKVSNKNTKQLTEKKLNYTPRTAWVQAFGKQPRLLGNSGVKFVPSPVIYGPCRPSQLSDYVKNKCARRSGTCLRFQTLKTQICPKKPTTTKATKKNITVYSDTESDKLSTLGASEPSPKRVNQKKTSRLW